MLIKKSMMIFGLFLSVIAFFYSYFILDVSSLFLALHTLLGLIIGLGIGWLLNNRHHLDQQQLTARHEIVEKEKQLVEKTQELDALYFNNSAWIWSIDLVDLKLKVSNGLLTLFGYTKEEIEADYQLWSTKAVENDKYIVKNHFQRLMQGKHSEAEWRIYKKDGSIAHIRGIGEPIFDSNGQVIRLVGVAFDLSKEIEMQETMSRIAMTDTLTQLPNQLYFNRSLEQTLEQMTEEDKLALLYFNVDRLKFINEMHGFETGDEILKLIGERLPMYFGPETLMARYGGDEFIVAYIYHDEEAMKVKVDQFMESFRSPFLVESHELLLTISSGASLYPADAVTFNSLLSKANAALKGAKRKGKNNVQFYIRENEELQKRRLRIEHDLKWALEFQEFELYYQPKVSLVSGSVQGAEALIRWQHPILGEVSPAEFIPIAEQSGQIVFIGNWVMNEALRQVKIWEDAGHPLRIAVNVSSAQLEVATFMDSLQHMLTESGITPSLLGVELTEGMVQNIESAVPILFELRQLGVTIYIDDFGTGYSSLGILNQLPIDYIKIDKSFIQEVPHNKGQATLVKTIIEMGRNLGFELVAEGVEREEQAEFLLQNGCTRAQGFYFSHPLPVHEFEKRYLS